ncbi:MAG: hypothetical protein RBR71_13330 [Gudongella sp.]|nr:hypothetical protein [Gudongella sp.]
MGFEEIIEKLVPIYQKADAQLSNEKFSFLSQIDLSEEEFDCLKDNYITIFAFSSPTLDEELNPDAKICNLLTSIVAVDSGFVKYNDEGYWDNFSNYLDRRYEFSNKDRGEIRRIVERTVHRYGLDIDYEIEGESVQKNINAVLMQTFVPVNYLSSFFDYAYSVYDDVRDDEKYNDLYGYFEDLAVNFRVPLKQDNSQTASMGGNKLINSTKRVMRDPNAFGPILEKIFTRFDTNNTRNEDTDLGRFEQPFNEWFTKNQEIIRRSKGRRHKSARFYLDDEDLLGLIVPDQIIGEKKDSGLLVLSSPGKQDVVIKADVYSDTNGKRIREYRFGRKFTFFEKFELYLNEKNITPSLNMERFLIFNSYREQIDSPVDKLFYVAVNSGVEIVADNCNLYTKIEGVRIFAIHGKPASTVTIGDRQYFIGRGLEKVRASIGASDTGIVCQTDGISIPVLSKHPTVCFDVGKKAARKSYVELIRGDRTICPFRLGHAYDDDVNSLKVIDLNSGPNVEFTPGRYELKIRIGGETESYGYFLLSDARAKFAEKLYREECTSTVDFGSDIVPVKEFNTFDDAVRWDQEFDGREYQFAVPIPSLKYDLGYGEMFVSKLELGDLGTNIEIKCPLFSKPRLVIKYDKKKVYRKNLRTDSFYFDISDIRTEMEKRKPAKCVLLLSEGGVDEEIFSIATSSIVEASENKNRTELTVVAKHIADGSTIDCIVEKDLDVNTFTLSEEEKSVIDVSDSCRVTVKEIASGKEDNVLYTGSFNFVEVLEDTDVRGDCNSIRSMIKVSVDFMNFYVDGNQFICMLNNGSKYDPKEILKKSEERWSKMIGINKKDMKMKSMFMKACDAVRERIVMDELERGNRAALEALTKKFDGTDFFELFQKSVAIS